MVYLLILIFLLIAIFSGCKCNFKFYAFVSFVLLLLTATLRYRVGTDALLYHDVYENYYEISQLTYDYFLRSRWSFLFIMFFSLCYSLCSSFIFFQFVYALIFLTILFFIVKKYLSSSSFFVVILLFYINSYFYLVFDLCREGLAVSVFLLAVRFLEEKKWVYYYIFCIICFFIHTSAIICFFIPLVTSLKLSKINSIIILISSILFRVIVAKYFVLFVSYIPIDSVRSLAMLYISLNSDSIGQQLSVMEFIYIVLIYLWTVYFNIGKVDSKYNFILNIAFLYILLKCLDGAIPLMFRLNNYLIIFASMALSYFIERNVFKKFSLIKFAYFFVLILFFSSIRIADMIKSDITRNAYFPYVSVFEKKKIMEREWHDSDAYKNYDLKLSL